MSEVQVAMSVADFNTAGLEAEGIYRLRVRNLEVQERTVKTGKNVGDKYKTIAGQFELVEAFGEGLIENPQIVFANFSVNGRGLERFRKLYIAALGPVADGDANQVITLNDLAAALIGCESVWTTYSWRRNTYNTDDDPKGEIVGNLGFSFSQDPGTLQAPRTLADREAA